MSSYRDFYVEMNDRDDNHHQRQYSNMEIPHYNHPTFLGEEHGRASQGPLVFPGSRRRRSRSWERTRSPETMDRKQQSSLRPRSPEVFCRDNPPLVLRQQNVSPSHPQELSSLKDASLVWTPSNPQDTTIHLEMAIEEDIESYLEEFSRLKRLGNFTAAEQYFQSHLSDYLGLAPVAVEYADLLLEQGAYKRLNEMVRRKDLACPKEPDPRRGTTPAFLYQIHFQLMLAESEMISHGMLRQAIRVAQDQDRLNIFKHGGYKLNSTEVRRSIL